MEKPHKHMESMMACLKLFPAKNGIYPDPKVLEQHENRCSNYHPYLKFFTYQGCFGLSDVFTFSLFRIFLFS